MHNRPEIESDEWLRQLVRNQSSDVPPPEVDAAILARAQTAAMKPPSRAGFLVWPLSLAASIAVVVGIFSLAANLLPGEPTIVVMTPSVERPERPPQAIGDAVDAAPQTWQGTLSDSGAGSPESQVIALMRAAMVDDDDAAFRRHHQVWRELGVTSALPTELEDHVRHLQSQEVADRLQ